MHTVHFKGNLICFEETAMYTLSYKETHSGAFFAQQEPYVFSTVLLYTFWHEHKAGMLIYSLADQMEKAEQWTFWIKVRAIFVTCPKRDFMDQHLTEGNIFGRPVAQRQCNRSSSSYYPHFNISCTTADKTLD